MRRVRGMAPARVAATVGAMLAGLAIAAIPVSAMADLAPGTSDEVQSLAVSPDYRSDRTLFVGGYYSMWRSTDGGAQFSVLSGAPLDIEDIAVSPAFTNDKTLFVASKGNRYGAGTGIYRSTDSGGSWQLASGGLPAVRMPYRLRISPGFATDRTVFALVNEDLYKSTDAGGSWTKATPPVGGMRWPSGVSTCRRRLSPTATSSQLRATTTQLRTQAAEGHRGASRHSACGGARASTTPASRQTSRWTGPCGPRRRAPSSALPMAAPISSLSSKTSGASFQRT